MDFELNETMRELYDTTGEKNPHTAAQKLLDMIPRTERNDVLLFLLQQHYSTFLSSLRSGKRTSRRTPAVNPNLQTGRALEELDARPIYVPILRKRINWAEMTEEYWQSFIDYRWGRAAGYQASAQWGEQNIAALRTSHVSRSGDLPILVKRELFDVKPDDPEDS